MPRAFIQQQAPLAALLALSAGLLCACGTSTTTPEHTTSAAPEQTWPAVAGTELPIDTAPEPTGQSDTETTCPYLDATWLENTNGQKWTGTGVDKRFDTPACTFWSYEDVPQATVLVRSMSTNRDAVAVVDHFAPIDGTLKALEPDGWSGGRSRADNEPGTVYAVWKDNIAVVVTSAQDQTIKPEQIATETIKNLGL